MSFRFPPPRDPRGRPPAPLEELVDGVGEEELARLRPTDALLRSVPGPPAEVPASLTSAVTGVVRAPGGRWTRRRTLAAIALAAALSALSFAGGALVGGGDDFEARASFSMRATANAQGASALVTLGERDRNGNWPLRLRVEGLAKLPQGGYYTLWLARDGERGPTCGSFAVGDGRTEAEWTVSYRLEHFDEWVVTAWVPGAENENPPRLLEADVAL